ncbi:MAG TPA: helix-turn-helix transcriptional regulator, partial [Bryobacteraceae bacterium]|nr:helix-turn-helix transcriptional regulator [Bryobacteraceae bacterium]
MRPKKDGISNCLADLRRQRGCSAAELAESVGVSRQTIHAIEANTYIPNTALALRLAGVLEVTVEEIFQMSSEPAVSRSNI